MRCFTNCLILATIALVGSETRQKRDLTYLKNLLTSVLGRRLHDEPSPLSIDLQPRFYRVSGFGDRVFRVINKQDAAGTVLQERNEELGTPIGRFREVIGGRETVYTVPSLIDTYDTELKVKVPIETNYAYTQLKNNKPVMTYTAHSDTGVIVSEEMHVRTVLPTCIKQRIDQVILIGANPYTVSAVYPSQTQASVNIEYPKVNVDVLEQKYKPLELTNPHKIYVNSSKDDDKIANSIRLTKIFESSIGSHKTVGLIPPPYIAHDPIKQYEQYNHVRKYLNTNVQTFPANQQLVSKYSYKQINRNIPKPVTVVKLQDQIDNNIKMNVVDSNAHLPRDYVLIPPNVQDSVQKPFNNTKTESKTESHKSTKPGFEVNKDDLLKKNPIVVEDPKTFSYHQKHLYGSSIRIKSGSNGVSVDLKNSTKTKYRGDIPEPIM